MASALFPFVIEALGEGVIGAIAVSEGPECGLHYREVGTNLFLESPFCGPGFGGKDITQEISHVVQLFRNETGFGLPLYFAIHNTEAIIEGPSIGLATYASLCSLVGKTLRYPLNTTCFTGDVRISGHVGPIGGLKQKSSACAQRRLTLVCPYSHSEDARGCQVIKVKHSSQILL